MATISIVIPVYNVEQYIKSCVNSILAQTYADWELILIDDGSSDSSGYICDSFAIIDERIKCIHKQNGGVTEARRSGWEISTGEWITFVDGDDTLPNNSLEVLYNETIKTETDIVEAYHYIRHELPQIDSIDDYRSYLLKGVGFVSVAVWGKLFRKAIINTWCFDIPRDIVRGEDWIMNIRIAFLSRKKPILLQQKVYNYRDNITSLSHTYKKNIDLEYAFFKVWRDSIPYNHNTYNLDIFKIAVSMFVGVCVQDLRNTKVIDSPFAKSIRDMNKGDEYSLMLHQRILLNSKCKWLRVYTWKMYILKEKIFNKATKFLRH